MNRRAKGKRILRKAIELLQQQGYIASDVEKVGRFIKDKDLFGVADILALKRNEVLFLQVTCGRPHNHTKYKAFGEAYTGSNVKMQQWVWLGRGKWKTFDYTFL